MKTSSYENLLLVIVLPHFDHGASYAEDVWDIYWFEKNLQGDIIAVYDQAGNKLIAYKYDAWGNISETYYNNGFSTTAINNPFRYRGYYYDQDLGLYYLNTRYYDSNTGRFINADEVMSGVNGSLQGFNLYVYCFNNPIMHTDYTGNWPSWKSIEKWVKNKYETWKEESFVYNVIVQNITADAGLGIGIGGELEVGKIKISAISRVDAIGIETKGIDIKEGHHGKSSFSIGVGGYYVGAEWKTYESYDGTAYERSKSMPEAGWTLGGEAGFVIAAHASLTVSFSGIYEDFVEYGRNRAWWK